ncbi:MAG: GNAT family N-acetyltransferase [Armatimonadetes bacterium]|nr:GNAT family N-acetyltransferase [Armatimonadota bacterium]
MSFSIRPASPADSAAAARVVQVVYQEYGFLWEPEGYHADLYDLHTHYLARGHQFWVAEQEGRVIGTAGLELFEAVPGPPGELVLEGGKWRVAGCDSSLERLYVLPSARRCGVGRALFSAAVQAARQADRRGLEIWSDQRFQEAHQLYGSAGAALCGERICDDPDESPEWGLVLWLRGG